MHCQNNFIKSLCQYKKDMQLRKFYVGQNLVPCWHHSNWENHEIQVTNKIYNLLSSGKQINVILHPCTPLGDQILLSDSVYFDTENPRTGIFRKTKRILIYQSFRFYLINMFYCFLLLLIALFYILFVLFQMQSLPCHLFRYVQNMTLHLRMLIIF